MKFRLSSSSNQRYDDLSKDIGVLELPQLHRVVCKFEFVKHHLYDADNDFTTAHIFAENDLSITY
jgi:hypothetical protein